MQTAYLALGSNLGDRLGFLAAARRGLSRLGDGGRLRTSPIYETAPVGGPAGQGRFLNQVVSLRTDRSARGILEASRRIETACGRAAPALRVRDGPRPLDIDLLLLGDSIIDEPGLCLPHPRMHRRRFVLAPLADLDPALVVPPTRRTVAELLEGLD